MAAVGPRVGLPSRDEHRGVRAAGHRPVPLDDRGFSLMEVMAATVIATIAVIGLAHTFGIGRSLINRFEVLRAAKMGVQSRFEVLSATVPTSSDLALGVHPPAAIPFVYAGTNYGNETWLVENWNDPATPSATDMKRVTVRFAVDAFGVQDTVRMSRLFPTR